MLDSSLPIEPPKVPDSSLPIEPPKVPNVHCLVEGKHQVTCCVYQPGPQDVLLRCEEMNHVSLAIGRAKSCTNQL